MNKCFSLRAPAALVALLLSTLQLAYGQTADAPGGDPNLSHPNEVVTVAVQGYTISGLVTHLPEAKAFRYGVALFPGYPGIMKLREENGQPRFELRGNFLVRSRRHWLDEDTLVIVVDAPSDQWATFPQWFRETPRYGADVAALLNEVARRFRVEDWTFVGTSEGSVSAFHAARMNPGLARRVILTSSVFQPSRNGPGMSWVSWNALSAPLLWVHHENDPCRFTSYRDAQRFAEKSHSPLITVRGGGPWRGDACEAFTAHGFVGIESETVAAMHSWVKTGTTPRDVAR
jgi:pimeloyl-ACP methyl ester carboxylesterase